MRIFCIRCKQSTNQEIVADHSARYDPDSTPGMQIDFAEGRWQVIECRGCGEISFREVWVTSEDYNPDTNSFDEVETVYPRRTPDALSARSFLNAPQLLRRLYSEVIDSYNFDLATLCAGGIRALIEGICVDQGIKTGPVIRDGKTVRSRTLEGKIEGLHEHSLLTAPHAQTLHQHRFMGNHALHELDQPPKEELRLAIEILEHTLETLYEITPKAEELRRAKNLRRRRPTKRGAA